MRLRVRLLSCLGLARWHRSLRVGSRVLSRRRASASTRRRYAFYFPVGLAVSKGGNVLYAVNSDFDLQWNGGTIQSLDLHLIRRHAVARDQGPDRSEPAARAPADPERVVSERLRRSSRSVNDAGVAPGWACAPPTNASYYMRDSVVIGAFATDLQALGSRRRCRRPDEVVAPLLADSRRRVAHVGRRIANDDPERRARARRTPPTRTRRSSSTAARASAPSRRCDSIHHVGNDPNQPGDTRLITMPGEPFGMAQIRGRPGDRHHPPDRHEVDASSRRSRRGPQPQSTVTTARAPVRARRAFRYGGIGDRGDPARSARVSGVLRRPDRGRSAKAVFPRPAFLQTSLGVAQVALLRLLRRHRRSGPLDAATARSSRTRRISTSP